MTDVEIILNGAKVNAPNPLSYAALITLMGKNPDHVYTVVWSIKRKDKWGNFDRDGSLIPGQSMEIEPGMHFTAMMTGNA